MKEYHLGFCLLLISIAFPLNADNGDDEFLFQKEPSLFENFWFYAFLGLLLLFLIALITFLRHRFTAKKYSEIEQVRRNAARDFHDELGSKLSIISMYSELAKSKLSNENFEAQQYLDKVIQTSSGLYGSMKDLLWTLNPEKDSLRDLFYQLRDFGNELYEHSLIKFETQTAHPLEDIKLPMSIKRHILLIFKEAMNNALKHSKAQNALLIFKSHKDNLYITFKDNGQGFLPMQINDKGDGLKNMQDRARKMNARLIINTTNSGTIIQLNCKTKLPLET